MGKKDEEKQSKSGGGWSLQDYVTAGLWLLIGAGMLAGGSKMLGGKGGRGGASVRGVAAEVDAEGVEGALEARVAAARAAGGRSMRNWHPALHGRSLASDNYLLDLPKITWADIQAASEEQVNQALASILFAAPEKEVCSKGTTWVPRNRAERPGSWPLCADVPRPVPSRCHMYSIGVYNPPDFDISGATELGCNVRSFDPHVDNVGGLPHGVTFESVGMGAHNSLDSKPRIATLSTLMGFKHEQGRHLYLMKTDCEGCEWPSFDQQLKDLGPDAFHDYDMVMFKTHFGSEGYTPKKAMALAALLYNQGFRMYYRRTSASSPGGKGTQGLLAAVEAVHGAAAAAAVEASKKTLLAVGADHGGSSYQESDFSSWKKDVVEGAVVSSIEYAFVREMSLPHPVTLVQKEYAKCAEKN